MGRRMRESEGEGGGGGRRKGKGVRMGKRGRGRKEGPKGGDEKGDEWVRTKERCGNGRGRRRKVKEGEGEGEGEGGWERVSKEEVRQRQAEGDKAIKRRTIRDGPADRHTYSHLCLCLRAAHYHWTHPQVVH